MTTACELGFGQGLSTNIHAAAGPATWFATDFNPAQAANAQKVAQASNNGAHLYDQAFSGVLRSARFAGLRLYRRARHLDLDLL